DASSKTMTFEDGWPFLQVGVDKLIGIIEGAPSNQFTSEEYMQLYTTVYTICAPNPLGPEVQKLYDQYKKTFEDYITSKVVPSLRGKEDEILLKELVKRWEDHKVMTRWLSRFFHYLDRYFLARRKLPTTSGTSFMIFYKLVGQQIDEALVKNVLNIYLEMAESANKYYEKDFEEAMLKNTAAFAKERASSWIASESHDDYILKIDGCLKEERDRVSRYLPNRSQNKVLEVLEHELRTLCASKLAETKDSDGEAA
ncbi:hypothetical protein RJ639_027453, partial [Escallonia herrerae]